MDVRLVLFLSNVTGPASFGLVWTDIATRFVTCFSALGSRRWSRACPGKMASRPRLSARGKACRRGMRQHPARRLERDAFSFDFRRHCERSEAITIRSHFIRVISEDRRYGKDVFHTLNTRVGP